MAECRDVGWAVQTERHDDRGPCTGTSFKPPGRALDLPKSTRYRTREPFNHVRNHVMPPKETLPSGPRPSGCAESNVTQRTVGSGDSTPLREPNWSLKTASTLRRLHKRLPRPLRIRVPPFVFGQVDLVVDSPFQWLLEKSPSMKRYRAMRRRAPSDEWSEKISAQIITSSRLSVDSWTSEHSKCSMS